MKLILNLELAKILPRELSAFGAGKIYMKFV